MRLIFAFILILTLLSACAAPPVDTPLPTSWSGETPEVRPGETLQATLGSTPASSSTKAVPTLNSNLTVPPEALRGVQVTFWHPWNGDLAKALDEQAAAFNQQNVWGITVQAAPAGSLMELESHLADAEKNGGLPSLVVSTVENLAADGRILGGLVDLSAYEKDPAWGYDPKELADLLPVAREIESTNTQGRSLPFLLDMTFLTYNQTWAGELGFSQAPISPDEFRQQACAAEKANLKDSNYENNGTGGYLLDASDGPLVSWLRAFSASLQPQGDVVRLSTPEAVQAFTWLRKLLDDSCAWVGKNPTPYDYFASRQSLFYSSTLQELVLQARTNSRLKSSDLWTVIPYPAQTGEGVDLAVSYNLAILPGKPEEQLASWLFLRWLLMPRNQASLAAAGDLIPARNSAAGQMQDYQKANPQWAAAYSRVASLQGPPAAATWRLTLPVLEDAAWQIFQPYAKPADIKTTLDELDATVQELVNHK